MPCLHRLLPAAFVILLGACAGTQQTLMVTQAASAAPAGIEVSLAELVADRLGRPLDADDAVLIDASLEQAIEAPAGSGPASWVRPGTGHEGAIELVGQTTSADGRRCVRLTHRQALDVTVTGRLRLCHDATGRSWQLADQSLTIQPEPTRTAPEPADTGPKTPQQGATRPAATPARPPASAPADGYATDVLRRSPRAAGNPPPAAPAPSSAPSPQPPPAVTTPAPAAEPAPLPDEPSEGYLTDILRRP